MSSHTRRIMKYVIRKKTFNAMTLNAIMHTNIQITDKTVNIIMSPLLIQLIKSIKNSFKISSVSIITAVKRAEKYKSLRTYTFDSSFGI